MAEFEELEGIVVRWAYNTQNLLLSQIVDAAQDEGIVWILVRPSTSDSTNIKNYLTSRSIPPHNIVFLTVGTNSIWDRDYGPWTVYDAATDSMAILDFRYNRPRPLDDVVPAFLAQQWNLPLYQTVQMPDSLVHTGGNFMVDGFGTAFASKLIHNENRHHSLTYIDSILSVYGGITRFVTMDTLLYDGIHHIDMHMKLLDEETLLIGEYPPGVSDYQRIENTVNVLRTLSSCYGRPYRIIRIPMPPDNSGRYPPQSNYLTYTNSVFINRTVLVPVYSLPTDDAALQAYRDALPGYRILGFDCNAIIPQFGAIHCITKEVGVRDPVQVAQYYLEALTATGRTATKPLAGPNGPYAFSVVPSSPTSVRNGTTPDEYTLGQNHPNPFNPKTTLEFRVGRQESVRLDVFDVLGRRVATLVDGPVAPGSHSVNFDASGVSSGVYFYRLTAGGFVMQKRMLVVK
jgi:agmatine/peptidylarginine deiminase